MIEAVIERCAGIDVGKKFLVACVMTGPLEGEPKSEIRKFGTIVAELELLRDWLIGEGKLQTENWKTSTDHSAAFFGSDTLSNLLYGHFLRHKENTSGQVHRVIIGLNEAFAGEVQIQFDMPDATEVAEACGAVLHKR